MNAVVNLPCNIAYIGLRFPSCLVIHLLIRDWSLIFLLFLGIMLFDNMWYDVFFVNYFYQIASNYDADAQAWREIFAYA